MMMMEGAVSKDIFFAKERPARESCRDTYVLFIYVLFMNIYSIIGAHMFFRKIRKKPAVIAIPLFIAGGCQQIYNKEQPSSRYCPPLFILLASSCVLSSTGTTTTTTIPQHNYHHNIIAH